MINCIFCKKPIENNFLFCPFCGKKQIATTRKTKKRGNGQGTIFKHGNGYAVEITLGYVFENGKMKRRSRRKCGFVTKKAAISYLENLRNEPVKPSTITIHELWERFRGSIDLSKTKTQAYEIAYNRIKPLCEFKRLDDFTVSDLQNIVDTVADTYYTQRDVKNLFSHFYKIALQDDLVDKNRAQYIKLVPRQLTERTVFNDDEIQKLWADYEKTAEPITAAVLIMLYTGMRTGECKQLKAENIHLDEHYLTGGIKTEKGKNRKIIIPDKIVPIFRQLLDVGKLFNEYGRNYLFEQWKTKRAALGIRDELTLYCCRHTYLTRLTELNVSPAMLQELAGHEDYETTLNYTHLSVDDRLQAVNKL